MSSDEASPTSTQSRAFPPLTDEARKRFFDLVHTYCTNLPKSHDTDDFHLETVRFSAAIDVRPIFGQFFVNILTLFQGLVHGE